MASVAKGKGSRIAVWTILVLLIVGLAGFGTTNFGGFSDSIGTIGNRNLDLQRYARVLQDRIRAHSEQTGTNLSITDAVEMGLDQVVLRQLITTAALENEAERLGVSAGDEAVRETIVEISAFEGLDGNFDKETYSFVLDNAGLNEQNFEEDIRREIARNLVQNSITGGVSLPDIYVDTVFRYVGEQRSFAFATLQADMLESEIPEPSHDELQSHFDENSAEFMLPETRNITFAWLTPEMLIDTIEIDEEMLQSLYEENIDEYVIPERRLVERLVLGDEAADAKARLDASELTFEELVAERKLELGDIDLGDVSEEDLGTAGAAVFAIGDPGIVGPEDTPFGPAIFRVNAILAAQNTTFDEAREELVDQFALERGRRNIADMIDGLDDLLAGGATLEELADETELQLGQMDWTTASVDGIAAYQEFREAVADAAEGDFPEITALDDGGVFALRIDSIIEPRLPEFADVKAELETGWRTEMTGRALAEQAKAFADRIERGVAPADLGLEMFLETQIRRDEYIPNAPFGMLETVFGMSEGDIAVHEGEATAHIIRLDEISPPDPTDSDNEQERNQIEQAAERSLSAELLRAYTRELEAQSSVFVDQAAINAVHSQFP